MQPERVALLLAAGFSRRYGSDKRLAGSPPLILRTLATLLRGLERTTLITEQPGYLYAQARTRLLRFTDDVEFSLDEATGVEGNVEFATGGSSASASAVRLTKKLCRNERPQAQLFYRKRGIE